MKRGLLFFCVLLIAALVFGCGGESVELPPPVKPEPASASIVSLDDAGTGQIEQDDLVVVENKEITITFIYGERIGLFTGALLDGKPSGYGTFSSSDTDGTEWSYTGFFDDGQFNGDGETVWETGACREGTYKNGSLIDGRFYADDGRLLYEGELGEQEEHTEEFIHFLINLEFPQTDSFIRDLLVHFIDVGQADSILIQLPNGKNMLIDGGEAKNANTILQYLSSHDIKSIDYLIASHPHADHIGGLPAIINAIDVQSVYMPRVVHTTQTYENLLISIQNKGLQIDEAKTGVSIVSLPELDISIIAPARDDYRDHNDHSAVIKLIYGETSFLFMGDAESTSESHITGDISADVLKVGHHGSRTSTTAAFLNRVAPSYAVISVGVNSYGHPTDEVLSRLNDADVEVYRTDMVGTITFTSDGENIIIDKSPSPYQPQTTPVPTPAPTPVVTDSGSGTSDTSGSDDTVVYITRTGERYHKDGCRHLSRSKIESTISAAKAQGLTACGTCRPPS